MEAKNSAIPPTSVSGVRSFLGMVSYCSKFINSFSSLSLTLRDLTKKGTQFYLSEQHAQSFNNINDLLTIDSLMACFDPNMHTELTTDASPKGLLAILMQQVKGRMTTK